MNNPKENLSQLLKNSFSLLESQEKEDQLWEKISQKLDQKYHEELFSLEFKDSKLANKEKYIIGLSEFIDGEVPLEKSELINDHLSTCLSCRENYLSFLEISKALNYTYITTNLEYQKKIEEIESQKEDPENELWKNLCKSLDFQEKSILSPNSGQQENTQTKQKRA